MALIDVRSAFLRADRVMAATLHQNGPQHDSGANTQGRNTFYSRLDCIGRVEVASGGFAPGWALIGAFYRDCGGLSDFAWR